MGKRRFTQVSTSEDEDEGNVTRPPPSSSKKAAENSNVKGKKKGREVVRKDEDEEMEEEEEEEETTLEDAKPIGNPIKTSGKGRFKKTTYSAFEFDGHRFELEDPVLLTPEEKGQKPYVAIIKEITQRDVSIFVTGQWFYRPEEAEKKGGGCWQPRDTRELFYSFHRDEVPAESVMHKCVVHFVPLHKQLPLRSQYPGFIVQKVYDTVEKKLWKLTDKDYEDSKQHEIDLLVQKTCEHLGELPDIETEEAPADQDDLLKNKRFLRRKNMSPIDVSREDETTARSDQLLKAETPGSCTGDASEFYTILAKFKALTGDTYRDKWLEKILQGIQSVCNSKGNKQAHDMEKDVRSEDAEGTSVKGGSMQWPDAAVPAVTALEKASHDALGSDFQKYNQKMRQLEFNLKVECIQMAKKEGKRKSSTPCSRYQFATLREESNGKKHVKGFTNANSTLRMQHLKNLAIWAGAEASVRPLGALFGHHLAASGEAMGMPLDSSLFPCQRCETVLQPGHNCTVRIEKNTTKVRRRRKPSISTQNNLVYTCSFCSHRNLKRGTPKGHMKEIWTSKLASEPIDGIDNKSASSKKDVTTRGERCSYAEEMSLKLKPILDVRFDKSDAALTTTEIPTENSPTTPMEKMRINLLEKKSKSSEPGSNKVGKRDNNSATVESGKSIGGSSKRKRKAWSTLKEIAENSELSNSSKVSKFTIPFVTGNGM